MLAGHIGAGLALGSAERRLSVGLFILAAVLLDAVLWIFVLLGWESVTIPADFAQTHQARFTFPYTHSLVAAIIWAVLAAVVVLLAHDRLGTANLRAAILIAAAVFSHWILDALVHAPEMPLAGAQSAKVGLSLWNNLPLALTFEAAILVTGLWFFLSGAALSRARKIGLATLALLTLALTIAGMTVAPPPPSVTAMAVSSLVTLAVVCGLAGWLARRPGARGSRSERS